MPAALLLAPSYLSRKSFAVGLPPDAVLLIPKLSPDFGVGLFGHDPQNGRALCRRLLRPLPGTRRTMQETKPPSCEGKREALPFTLGCRGKARTYMGPSHIRKMSPLPRPGCPPKPSEVMPVRNKLPHLSAAAP